jgi:hypothetical protein
MAKKLQAKTEPEQPVETKPALDDACLIAVEAGHETFATIKNNVVKAQRVIPVGTRDDWPMEFDKALLRLVRSGRIAVTNGKYWIRTGQAPKWGHLDPT